VKFVRLELEQTIPYQIVNIIDTTTLIEHGFTRQQNQSEKAATRREKQTEDIAGIVTLGKMKSQPDCMPYK
jgi:hypothetical protein